VLLVSKPCLQAGIEFAVCVSLPILGDCPTAKVFHYFDLFRCVVFPAPAVFQYPYAPLVRPCHVKFAQGGFELYRRFSVWPVAKFNAVCGRLRDGGGRNNIENGNVRMCGVVKFDQRRPGIRGGWRNRGVLFFFFGF